jgi:hypothetical protein
MTKSTIKKYKKKPKIMHKIKTKMNIRKNKSSHEEENVKLNKLSGLNEQTACSNFENEKNPIFKNLEISQNTNLIKDFEFSELKNLNLAQHLPYLNCFADSLCNRETMKYNYYKHNIYATQDHLLKRFKTFEKLKFLFALYSNSDVLLHRSIEQMFGNFNILMNTSRYLEKLKCKYIETNNFKGL